MSKDENWLIFPSANIPHLNSGCQVFRGLFWEILVDNHRNVWLSFRRQKYNIENTKSSIWGDFFKKEQKSSFKKSEAPNLLIINPNFWFFLLIFNIQKNQDPRRKEIVYRRKTWRRIKKSCWSVDWFFFKFCPFREGDLFFREGVFIFCADVFHTTPPFQLLTFSKAIIQPKKSEIGIVNQTVKVFWFFEGCFRMFHSL